MGTNPTSTFLSPKVSEAAKVVLGIPKFVDDLPRSGSSVPGPNEETDLQVAERYIWDRLSKLGIYNDDDSNVLLMSPDCTEGDARHVFCENGEPNLPVVRFKKVWSILKSGAPVAAVKATAEEKDEAAIDFGQLAADLKTGFGAMKPIGQWTDAELMAKYAPDCPDEISDELNKRAKGRPFVVFADEVECTVDVEASLRLLKEARKRETPIHYKAGDALKRLFRAGDFPTQVYFECPLHKGVLLLDGYCDECGHTWEGVDYDVRQFVRVIADNGEAPESGPSIRQLIAAARQCGRERGYAAITEDYPKVWAVFQELAAEDKLPSLKSRTASSEARKADPFAPSRRF
jgi:hypothetical protein